MSRIYVITIFALFILPIVTTKTNAIEELRESFFLLNTQLMPLKLIGQKRIGVKDIPEERRMIRCLGLDFSKLALEDLEGIAELPVKYYSSVYVNAPAEIHQQPLRDAWLTFLNLSNNRLGTLPESFGKLAHIRTIDLSNNQLTSLPESFGNFVNLDYLDLSENNITSLPESFGKLAHIRVINLSNNQLTSLPESFGNLVNLDYLDLSENNITSLPESFGELARIRSIDLSNNQLTSLPESFGNLVNLDYLDLSGNNITVLPESFKKLTKLRFLNVAINNLKQLDNYNLPIKSLNISYNPNLSNYDHSFWSNKLGQNLYHEQTISMKDIPINRLLAIRPYHYLPIGTLIYTLDLSYLNLVSIDGIENLIVVAKHTGNQLLSQLPIRLKLNNNTLTTLPDSLMTLNLQALNVSHNRLTELPDSLMTLNLQALNVSHNRLTDLPNDIGQLHKTIKSLNIAHNLIEILPESIDTLHKLTELNISNNKLRSLPESITQMSNLRKLILFGNLFEIRAVFDKIDDKEKLRGIIYYDADGNTNKKINAFLTKLAHKGGLHYFDLLQTLRRYKSSGPEEGHHIFNFLKRTGGVADIIKEITQRRSE